MTSFNEIRVIFNRKYNKCTKSVRVFSINSWQDERNDRVATEKRLDKVMEKPNADQLNYWLSRFVVKVRRIDWRPYPLPVCIEEFESDVYSPFLCIGSSIESCFQGEWNRFPRRPLHCLFLDGSSCSSPTQDTTISQGLVHIDNDDSYSELSKWWLQRERVARPVKTGLNAPVALATNRLYHRHAWLYWEIPSVVQIRPSGSTLVPYQ